MKKLLIILGLILIIPALLWAKPKIGYGVHAQYTNTGDSAQGVSVDVGTTTVVKVYTSDADHREIALQNVTGFDLYCSTSSSGFSATTGPRWTVPANTSFITHCTQDMHCIYESAAGAGTQELIGRIEFDSKD